VRKNRAVPSPAPSPLVGRAREREAIERALAALHGGAGGVVAIEGEPGIGKSRLLAHVAESAGCMVLDARASEFEADLPYALFTEALEGHLAEAGERRLTRLGLEDPGALRMALPSLGVLAAEPAAADRHRTHAALRDLLERLAGTRPVVACLDDVQWADAESLDALAALVRRPPAARVLLALAVREGQLPAVLAAAVGTALREERALTLALGPLSAAEARQLVGDAAGALFERSGGNPFYLEQLARVSDAAPVGEPLVDPSVPPAVAAALASELTSLPPDARRVLDAAAVVGDPFEPALAAAVADVAEPVALGALDELLACALVRPAGAPGRFAFRHPVVRHAVYVAAPGGWRLGAHGRAAAELARRGGGPVQRAHHVEHAASAGDEEAIALLSAAADELSSPAPATAARFYAAALRLLPDAQRSRRVVLRSRLADAQAAGGDPLAARSTLLEAFESAEPAERLGLTVALANQDWWLGDHEDARRRLHVELRDLPAQPSLDRVRLRLALGFMALQALDLADAQAQVSDARDDARALGEPVFEAAALACGAVATVLGADGGPDALDEAAGAIERLTPQQLATRLPALWMLARARRALGDFEGALAHLEHGAEIARRTGRERVLLVLTAETATTLIELGRIAEAIAAGEEALELARLAGNPRMLLWAQSALASAQLAAGQVAAALTTAEEAARSGTRPEVHAAAQPGWCLGTALVAAGNPERGVAAMLESFGGAALSLVLPADRPAAAADLVEARLARGDLTGAEEALGTGEAAVSRAGTPWAAAVAGIARSAVLLARGEAAEAAAIAAAACEGAATAPLSSARARLAEGRALAAAGDRPAARQALTEAEAAFDRFGARRRRDEAVRELRRLGHRVLRRAPEGGGLEALTAREREIAELVAAGRSNREIAEQLVLSRRTIEAHLRNIYGKLGVRSRVELARAAS
jgi:ATP/maltotriose-dependent transcriptional regulator MalT